MFRRSLPVLAAVALLAAGCAGDGDEAAAPTETSDAATGSETDGGSAAGPVGEAETDLGAVLVDADGFTLYGFTQDEPGTSSCTDGCAETWPPVTVEGEELPEGLDADLFSVLTRGDGSTQLAAGDWPLYTYAPDAAAGDTSGQGVGGVWFAVAPDGTLIESEGESGGASTGGDRDY